jgi:type II secretory pathway component PulC
MKNKKTVYVILPVVIGLWALVIYKIVTIYSASEGTVVNTGSFVLPILISNSADTFSIAANYRDPFLGKKESPAPDNAPKPAPRPEKVAEPIQWPAITYGGVIKSRKSNVPLCMVSINGQTNFMKEGEVAAGIQLKKIYKDSIDVLFRKEKKVVRK